MFHYLRQTCKVEHKDLYSSEGENITSEASEASAEDMNGSNPVSDEEIDKDEIVDDINDKNT